MTTTAPDPCSVVIASYNRAVMLGETLRSLAVHLDAQPFGRAVQVIVVDNNSSDGSAEVAQAHAGLFARFELLREKNQGLSFARNAGLVAATGDIVVFLDDDVELGEGWLPALLAPFQDAQVGVVGGKVLPFGSTSLPSWLPREYGYLVSVFDPADNLVEIDKVMGANFGVRRSVLAQIGAFDTKLGRKGKKLLGGEEVELFMRVRDRGHKIIFQPVSVVFHKIAEKLSTKYVTDYAYWLGVSEARLDRTLHGDAKFLAKMLRSYLFPVLVYPLTRHYWEAEVAPMRYAIKTQYAKGYRSSLRELR